MTEGGGVHRPAAVGRGPEQEISHGRGGMGKMTIVMGEYCQAKCLAYIYIYIFIYAYIIYCIYIA